MNKSVALLIDYENVQVEATAEYLLKFAQGCGDIVCKKAYARLWKRFLKAKKILLDLGFTLRNGWLNQRNSADSRCIFDCLDLLELPTAPDIFILVTGDSDFVELVRHLKGMRKQIIIFSRSGSVSKELRKLAHNFYFIDQLPQLIFSDNDV